MEKPAGATFMPSLCRHGSLVELLGLGRSRECRRGSLPLADDAGDFVEVTRADLALMAGRGVAERFARELLRLKIRVRTHAARLKKLWLSAWKPASVTNWNL